MYTDKHTNKEKLVYCRNFNE